MEEWIRCNIGDVCDTISDTYKGDADQVVLVNTSDVLDGKCLNHQKSPNKDLKGQFKKTFQRDDILYSEIRPANKRFAYIDFDGTDYIASTKLMVIRHKENIIPQFLYYIITSQAVIEELQMLAESRSGTFPQITFTELANQPIELPPLSEQAKIVRFLKSIDDKIEVNRRINDNFFEVMLIWLLISLRNDNLELQAHGMFRSWFVDFEPFKDGDFVESELGIIPKGWRVGTLSDLGEVVGGSTPSKAKPEFFTDNGIAWLTPKDLSISNRKFTSKGEIDITQEGYESCSTKLMPKGTVLFSSRAPIGYITIAKNDICTNQGFKSIVPKNAGTTFIYCFLKASTPEIENKATGSTFKEASGALMKNLPVIIPEDVILDHFEDLMKPVFKQQEIIEDESRRLASLRDTILPRLMSGELRVNEIEK